MGFSWKKAMETEERKLKRNMEIYKKVGDTVNIADVKRHIEKLERNKANKRG